MWENVGGGDKLSTDKWKAENTIRYGLRITKQSGIPEALEKAAIAMSKQPTEIIREAIVEKLIRDGYLPESPKTE